VSRNRIVKFSLTTCDWSFDFSFRRKVWRSIKRVAREYKQKYKDMRKAMKAAKAAQNLSPYQEAEMSTSQVHLIIELDEPGEELENLGGFSFSTEGTSVETLREYIQRRLRNVLNKRKIGDNFSFFSAGDSKDPFAMPEVLAKKNEKARYSKEFIAFKIDPNTQDGANYVAIQWEKKNEFFPISEFNPLDDLLVETLKKERDKARKSAQDEFDDNKSENEEETTPQVPDGVLLKELIEEERKERAERKRIAERKEAKKKAEEEAAILALTSTKPSTRGGLYG
jgi:hypothetical protein